MSPMSWTAKKEEKSISSFISSLPAYAQVIPPHNPHSVLIALNKELLCFASQLQSLAPKARR